MPWTPLEKFPSLALIQILAPSGSLGLGTPFNLQRASPYNLESMNLYMYNNISGLPLMNIIREVNSFHYFVQYPKKCCPPFSSQLGDVLKFWAFFSLKFL